MALRYLPTSKTLYPSNENDVLCPCEGVKCRSQCLSFKFFGGSRWRDSAGRETHKLAYARLNAQKYSRSAVLGAWNSLVWFSLLRQKRLPSIQKPPSQ